MAVDLANFLTEPQQTAIKALRGPLPGAVLEFNALIAQCSADYWQSQRFFHPDDIASYSMLAAPPVHLSSHRTVIMQPKDNCEAIVKKQLSLFKTRYRLAYNGYRLPYNV